MHTRIRPGSEEGIGWGAFYQGCDGTLARRIDYAHGRGFEALYR